MNAAAYPVRTWVNVTTSAQWNRPAVGIVRVEQALALHLREQLGRDRCRLCVWENDGFAQWTPEGEAVSSLGEHDTAYPLPGDILVSVGLDWDHPFSRRFHELAQMHRLRLVTCCHDMIPILFPQYCVPAVARKFADYIIEMTWASEAVLCVSEQTQRDYAAVCADLCAPQRRTVIIRHGDRPPAAGTDIGSQVGAIASSPFILFVSTIERRKNHEVLFRAYHVLARRGLASQLPLLVFVGMQGWGVDDLIHDIELDPATSGKIVRLNHVNDAELELLYRKAQFCLFPSLYEGWGLPVAEALAMGKAVIASEEGSINELGADLVRYVPAWDAYAWAAAIHDYVKNPELVASVEERVKATYVQRKWSDTAATVAALTNELAGKPPAAIDALDLLPGYHMRTQCGLHCGAAIMTGGAGGILLYGPYVPIRAGSYRIQITGAILAEHSGSFRVEVTSDYANACHLSNCYDDFVIREGILVDFLLELPVSVRNLEIRCLVESTCNLRLDSVRVLNSGALPNLRLSPPPASNLTLTNAIAEDQVMNSNNDQKDGGGGISPGQAATDLAGLLRCHGGEFVRCAYLTILRREPDKTGMTFYSGRLHDGAAKIQILAEMCKSPESTKVGAHVPGLERAIFYRRLATLPLIGRLMSWVLGIDGDSAAQVRLRSIEQQLHTVRSRLGANRVSAFEARESGGDDIGEPAEPAVIAAADQDSVLARSIVLAPGEPGSIISSFRKALSGAAELKVLSGRQSF
jgi:glycosyltransferase involved in cell wall biosynthesis